MGVPGFDPRSSIPSDARDEASAKKMDPTANEPFDPLNAAAGKAGDAQQVIAGTQLFQGPDGRAVTDTTDWRTGANVRPFESAHGLCRSHHIKACHTARRAGRGRRLKVEAPPMLRLVPQPQADLASISSPRSLVDQSVPASASPSASGDISELLKLRSIIQARGKPRPFSNPITPVDDLKLKHGVSAEAPFSFGENAMSGFYMWSRTASANASADSAATQFSQSS